MKKTTGVLCVVSVLTVLLPATTHATNIDFDSHYSALDGSNPILETGVRFDFNAAAWEYSARHRELAATLTTTAHQHSLLMETMAT